jgi:hypothetical protein
MRVMMLKDLYPRLTPDQVQALAEASGTKPVYLRQLSTGFRRPSLSLMVRLCKAEPRLKIKDLAEEFGA